MSTTATADAAATTDWRTYDGPVVQSLMFYAVFFPIVMAAFLALPGAICYCCLSRGRITPYTPPNVGGLGTKFPSDSNWPSVPSSSFPSKPKSPEFAGSPQFSGPSSSSSSEEESSSSSSKSPGFSDSPNVSDPSDYPASAGANVSHESPDVSGSSDSPTIKSFSLTPLL